MKCSEILITTNEYRLCLVKGKKALFHRWEDKADVIGPSMAIGGHNGGAIKLTLGIIEYEDGSINECYPREIKFIDNRLKEYCFE